MQRQRHTRRDFIKAFGIALAPLLATRCTMPGGKSQSPRGRLRDAWLRFDWLAEQSKDWDHPERGDRAREQLTEEHQAALDALVASGDLDAAVAEQVQIAYGAAVYHIWRSYAPMTCYEAVMVDYRPFTSGRLVSQAAALDEMARKGDLDPDTVALARAAIERDVTFLNLPGSEVQSLYTEILSGNEGGGIPGFDEVELEITPEAVQAAEFLAALLSEKD